MTCAIIDYESGNLHSAEKSFRRMAAEAGAGEVVVTSDPETVARAERIVLPGVGAFADCRAGLMGRAGLWEAISARVVAGAPFLGICVGMQLMADMGREHGDTPGFGWIPGEVVPIRPADPALKIPHMGWNDVVPTQGAPLIEAGEAYFLHSYHFDAANADDVLATTDHGGTLVAAVGRDNIMGVQFHPEKSQAYGINFLKRFLEWMP